MEILYWDILYNEMNISGSDTYYVKEPPSLC